jgi:hypothetical protein
LFALTLSDSIAMREREWERKAKEEVAFQLKTALKQSQKVALSSLI